MFPTKSKHNLEETSFPFWPSGGSTKSSEPLYFSKLRAPWVSITTEKFSLCYFSYSFVNGSKRKNCLYSFTTLYAGQVGYTQVSYNFRPYSVI